MTTTTTDKMLQRADDLEQRARALRLAAAEMNGAHVEGKRNGMHVLVAGASKLRAKQHDAANGNGHQPSPTIEEVIGEAPTLEDLVTRFLQDGPRWRAEIRDHVAAHGMEMSGDGLRYHLQRMEGVQASRKKGMWKLRKGYAPAAVDASMSPPDMPPARPPQNSPADLARRAAKTETIVAILRAHGKPMKVRDLAVAVEEAGAGKIQGIAGLITKGVLRARGQGPTRTYALAAS